MAANGAPILTGARARTNRAILDAAVAVLATDTNAALGQIADAASIGRTTLFRYYPDRAALLTALSADAHERLLAAHQRAALGEGTGAAAVERLCLEYVELLDYFALYFAETLTGDPLGAGTPAMADLQAVVQRGQADGSIDPALTAEWLIGSIEAMIYLVWETLTHQKMTRYDAIGQMRQTVRKIIAV